MKIWSLGRDNVSLIQRTKAPKQSYAPPFAPSHAPLYAPGGATDGSPCLIQAWVGAWVCTAWAWPCAGGWFVPSLLGSSS